MTDDDRFTDSWEDIQVDPASLPENQALLASVDAQIAAAEARRRHETQLAGRVAGAVTTAVQGLEECVAKRRGTHPLEEDLRSGIARALRRSGELVMTEPRLALDDWTANLGGFDLGIVVENGLVVGETKWADGNLRESIWDIFKLASAMRVPRVLAAAAVYAAPPKQWAKPQGPARLFEDRELIPAALINALPDAWAKVLAGSSARPLALPQVIRLNLLATDAVTLFGKVWEIRTVQVANDTEYEDPLVDGWTTSGRPEQPGAFYW